MPPFVLAETQQGINWLLLSSSILGIIVSVSVIVTGLRSVVRRAIDDMVTDKIQPHLDSDERQFDLLTRSLAEIQGELKGLHR